MYIRKHAVLGRQGHGRGNTQALALQFNVTREAIVNVANRTAWAIYK